MTKTYAEHIAHRLHGKIVEIYMGDTHETVTYADNSKNVHSAFVGKVDSAEGDVLVVQSLFKNTATNHYEFGNSIFINAYNIKAISEIDGKGTIKDALHGANDAAGYHKK